MLGSGYLRQGRPDDSRPLLREGLRRFQAAGDASGIVLVFDDLASQAVADGDLPRAARIRGAARRLTADTGVTLASFVEEQFEAFANAIGKPELLSDPKFGTSAARKANEAELDEIIATWTAPRRRYEIQDQLQKIGVIAVGTATAYDISAVLPHEEGLGQLLNAAFGYSSTPEVLTLGVHLAYLAVVLVLFLRLLCLRRTTPEERPGEPLLRFPLHLIRHAGYR